MEKLTINQGMIKVAELERNYRYKSPYIINRKKASITYILEADGGRFDCDEKFDFEKELNELISLSEEIEKIRQPYLMPIIRRYRSFRRKNKYSRRFK